MTVLFNPRSLLERRRKLRLNQAKAERVLWSHLRGRQLGVRFRRQYGVGGYIVDFYCPKQRLVIEVDGDSHAQPDQEQHDRVRTQELVDLKLRVIRFTNTQVLVDIEMVLRVINQNLN